MNLKYIYKILDNNEWQKAKSKGLYSGSSKDLQDGFIHFSGEEQITCIRILFSFAGQLLDRNFCGVGLVRPK